MSELVTIKVDGREFEVKPGELLIKVAEDNGTYIPRFCWHNRMKPVGMCRMCLVEVDTGRGPMMVTACTNEVAEGMSVDTENDTVKKAQEAVLEFLLANHPLDCPVCDKGGECPLQDQAMAYGPGESRFVEIKRTFEKPIPISDLVLLDRERCILCARCTRFSEEISGDPLIEFMDRGNKTEVNTFPDLPFSSYYSGNTVQICPVGALTSKAYRFRARPWDLTMVESSSGYDPAHPRLSIHVSHNEILRLVGVDSEPVNHGWLADKDRFGFEYVNSDERLSKPLVRRGDEFEEVDWAEALDMVANRLSLIVDESGGGSIGVLGGAQGTNEDAYAVSKFARTVLQTNNVSAILGENLNPHFVAATVDRGLISDLDTADTILVWGADLKEVQPTLYLRVRRAAQELGVNLIVVHPRHTGLDDRATATLRYRPGGGSDLLGEIAGGSMAEISDLLSGSVVAIVGQASLADESQLPESVAALVREKADKARIIPLASKANIYGALDMGLHPTLLPGRVAYAPGEISGSWGEIPEGRGKDAQAMVQALINEELRAILLVGADPVGDLQEPGTAVEALELAEYVVSIDTFLHESNRNADVILPAACFAEKEGTTTNLEGRVQKVNKIVPVPGQARPDWAILDDISSRMARPMGLATAATVAKEIESVAPAYRDITWDVLEWEERDGVVAGSSPETLSHIPVMLDGPSAPGAELTLHQSSVMYDDGVRLRHSPSLRPLAPGAVAYLNEEDAKRLGAQPGHRLRVVTKRGDGEFTSVIDDRTPAGVVFVPMNQPGAPKLGADPVVRVTVVT